MTIQNPKTNYVPDELLIRFKPGIKPTKEKQILEENGLTLKEEIEKIKVKLVKVAPEALETIEKKLSKNPNIDFVEKNMILEPTLEPNDQYYWKQWHLKNINAEYAWNVSLGSENVKIVICDSGVDENHPDLKDKLILPGWNFYDNNDNVTDVFGHGTMVIGTAAASTNNFIGVAAIAWKPKVIPVRVTDTKGYAYYSTLSKCLIYAADKGAKAASMSFLIFNGSSLTSAAKYLMDKGGLAFAAGGNTGKYENYTDNPYIVSVAATLYDNRATFSSYGPYIDLSAPGQSIQTTIRGGEYASASGTSFSSPLVAGLAALVFSINPNFTPQQVENILETTAIDLGDLGYDIYYGWGRIDAYAALMKAANITPEPDTTPPFVSINHPKNNQLVYGVTEIQVTATDSSGIKKVDLYVNGTLITTDEFEPYVFVWDTTEYKNGIYLLQAKAYDKYGNINVSTVYVNVQNCIKSNPTITITPITQIAPPGSSVSYSVIITNNDALTCNSSVFDLESFIPSGWSYYFESPKLAIAPGSKASTFLTITSSNNSLDGEYYIITTASSGNYSASTSASYIVVSSIKLELTTNKPAYILKEKVIIKIKATLSGIPAPGVYINLTITKPNGKTIFTPLTTDSNGNAAYTYKLNPRDPLGTYYVEVEATKNGLNGSSTTTFVVARTATVIDEIFWFFLEFFGTEY